MELCPSSRLRQNVTVRLDVGLHNNSRTVVCREWLGSSGKLPVILDLIRGDRTRFGGTGRELGSGVPTGEELSG